MRGRRELDDAKDTAPYGGVSDPELARALEGHDGIYRVCFRGMIVDALPMVLRVGESIIVQTTEAQYTRQVDIVQEPGFSVVFRKRAVQTEVGLGIPKTICIVPFKTTDDLRNDVKGLRDVALASVGVAAAILDERLAFEELFEDFVLIDDDGDEHTGDMRLDLRTFLPRVVGEDEERALDSLAGQEIDGVIAVAARWYLKAAQLGPKPDAVVFFWVAIEALADAEGKAVTKKVEKRLSEIDFDFGDLSNTVGRLYGLRAEIVHLGDDDPELLRSGYYDLEAVTRVLLRDALNVASTWPPMVGKNDWPSPFDRLVFRTRERHRTFWDPPIDGRR